MEKKNYNTHIWKDLLHSVYVFSFIILLIGCKSEPQNDLASVSGIVSESENNFLRQFHPESKIEQNEELVKITYEQPNLIFYLFKNEELAFVELPSGTYNNVNLDFTYNLTMQQALKEIYFYGTKQPEFLVLPTTTEEVFAYEMYKIGKDKLEFKGYFSPENFNFDVNEFENKNVLVNEKENQFSIYLTGKKDTLVCKKTSDESSSVVINNELKNKIQNFKSDKNSLSDSSEQTGPLNQKYLGTYSVNVETEQTTTGTATIQYKFSISNNEIILETNTFHEAVSCNGKYKGIEKNNILELYFTGNEGGCNISTPMFYLKHEKGEIFAKGLGSESTFNEWIKLQKV